MTTPREATPSELYAVQLAMTYSDWVNRRVERFDFIDAATVRRQMSIDFTLPAGAKLVGEGQHAKDLSVMVPVMMQKKGLLRALDVTDAEGSCLTVVESETGRDVTLAAVQRLIRTVAGVGLDEAATNILKQILNGKPRAAADVATAALGNNGAIWSTLRLAWLPRADETEDQFEAASAARQATADTLKALIEELAQGFMLLVAIPYRPGAPGLIKVGYDARIESSVRSFTQIRDGAPNRKRREGALYLINRALSSVGLVGRVERFTELPLRLGKSYHAEIVPVTGTYCEEANLSIEEPKPAAETKAKGGVRKRPEDVYRDFHHSRPHLWVGGGGRDTTRDEQGSVEVILFASREGLIFPLFFSTALIAGVLSLVAGHHRSIDGITLGALLLAPVALAAYYARSDENGYLTMAMRGVRWLATTAVIAAITVIALLALGYVEHPRGRADVPLEGTPYALDVAHWAARASLVCATVLFLALLAPLANETARLIAFPISTESLPQRSSKPALYLRVSVLPALVLALIGIIIIAVLWIFVLRI